MPEFRFRLPADWKLSAYHKSSIFVVGLDGIPWPCKVDVDAESELAADGPILKVIRNQEESGRVYLIYPLQARQEMLICTGTLPVRDTIYDLVKEVARGTLNRLRNQVSIWQEGGLEIADSIHEAIRHSIKCLGKAIMTANKPQQDQLAAESIELAMEAIFALAKTFGDQIGKFRQEHKELRPFWMANLAGRDRQFLPSVEQPDFDLFQVPFPDSMAVPSWDALKKRAVVGPWLDASAGGMPEELVKVDDYLSRRDKLLIICRTQLAEMPSTTSLIHLISGINGIGHRHLSYPQQLQIAVDMLQVVDESMVEVPVMISFDYPWAERLAGSVGGVHPLQIADSLLRQGLRISFLGLDINLDFWPNGSAIRDPLQWIDLIDVWAQLDLPLILCLRVPSGTTPVPPDAPVDRLVNQQRSNLSEATRLQFLDTVLPMMVARPSVHGMIWRQWQDGDDPRYPHAGLVDKDGHPKTIMQEIEKIRAICGSN